MKSKPYTAVLSVFGVTERPVRPHMPRTIYLYHPVRMTDGGFRLTNFRDTYTIRPDGYFFLVFSGTKTHMTMTDGVVGPPVPSGPDDGWGVSPDPSVSVIRPRIAA